MMIYALVRICRKFSKSGEKIQNNEWYISLVMSGSSISLIISLVSYILNTQDISTPLSL